MILKNGSVFYNGKFEKVDIEIKDRTITKVDKCLYGDESIDYSGYRIISGLFDIHTHGCLGCDFSVSDSIDFPKMCKFYLQNGITSILATTMTDEHSSQIESMKRLGNFITLQKGMEYCDMATIEGINMEGPFFGKMKKGAHKEEYLLQPSQEKLDIYNNASNKNITILNIDPTLNNAMDFIKRNKDNFILSMAHTTCDYETAKEAINNGCNHLTHIFNAMQPLLHRNPGIIGASFEDRIYCEMICDGIHIHKAVIKLMFSAMADRIVGISDSINPTGLKDGKYIAGDMPISVVNGIAKTDDGTIAGSTSPLFYGLKNLIKWGIPIEQAILSVTYNPAKSVNMQDKIGLIECGRNADLVIVNNDFDIVQIYKNGNRVK